MFHVPEDFRVTKEQHPQLGSDSTIGNNGFFVFGAFGYEIYCQASDGLGWEHVSVQINRRRTPTWEVMSAVKGLFWDDEDRVVQFHPPKSEYINNHPFVLHLWRAIDLDFPFPESILVGVKEPETEESKETVTE